MVPYCPTGPLLTSKLGKAIIMTSKLGKRSDLMDRDEILRKAKAENKNRDIYELEILNKGQRVGGRVAVAVTLALMIIEMMFFDLSMNYGYYLIIVSAAAGLWIYKAIKLRRRNDIIIAVMFTVISVYSAIMAIMNLIG